MSGPRRPPLAVLVLITAVQVVAVFYLLWAVVDFMRNGDYAIGFVILLVTLFVVGVVGLMTKARFDRYRSGQ